MATAKKTPAAKKKLPAKKKSFTHDMGLIEGTYGQFSNVANQYQGNYKRVLFICSAGLLRSATAAAIFACEPYNWNTRTAGCNLSYALNPVSAPLLEWADEVYVMEADHLRRLKNLFGVTFDRYKDKVKNLEVPDSFPYRHPELVAMLKEKLPFQESSNGRSFR